MKFTPKEIFRSGRMTFEPGNSYDSEIHGIPDANVDRWYAAGWCEVEGRDPAPERQVRGVVVRPQKAAHAARSTEG